MAVEGFLQTRTFVAGEDLSAKKYHFVKLNGSVGPTGQPVVVACSGATDKPCGVLQTNPVLVGEACTVAVGGWTKVSSDAALTVDTFVGTSADGQADAKTPGTDTTEYIMGIVRRASGAAAGIATIELVPVPYLAK